MSGACLLLRSLQSVARSGQLVFSLLLLLNFSNYFGLMGILGKCMWMVGGKARTRREKDHFTELSKEKRP